MPGTYKIVNKTFEISRRSEIEGDNKVDLLITYQLSDGVNTQVMHTGITNLTAGDMPDAATLANDEDSILELANNPE